MTTHTHAGLEPEQVHPGRSCAEHDAEVTATIPGVVEEIKRDSGDALRRLGQSPLQRQRLDRLLGAVQDAMAEQEAEQRREV